MKNITTFKKLIERYETITLDEIKKEWERNRKILGDNDTVGFLVAQHLTGFGGSQTCTLCDAVYQNCDDCVYGEAYGCLTGENHESYEKIEEAKTPRTLFNAFRNRAKHLRKTYKEIL